MFVAAGTAAAATTAAAAAAAAAAATAAAATAITATAGAVAAATLLLADAFRGANAYPVVVEPQRGECWYGRATLDVLQVILV